MALAWAIRLIRGGPLIILLCVWTAFALLTPYFLTFSNIRNVLITAAPVALLGLAALVVILTGALDLSLGATVGLVTIVVSRVFHSGIESGALAIAVGLLCSIAIGAFNGLLAAVWRVGPSLIVTLGTLYMVLSLGYSISGGFQTPGMPLVLNTLANKSLWFIPWPVVLVIFCTAILGAFLTRTAWGRWIFAVGGSPAAALKAGIPAKSVQFSVYVIGGFMAGVTGLLVGGLQDTGQSDGGGTAVLLAIAAVIVGGASITGGRGSVWFTVVGALILVSISNGLTLLSFSADWTLFALGVVLVGALALEKFRTAVQSRMQLRRAALLTEGAT